MPRIATLTASAIFLFPGLLLLAGPAAADEAELQQVREKVSGIFKEIEPDHVRPSPVPGWYTIRKGAIVAYVSADGRYLLQGDLIDMEQEMNLSEQSRNEARIELLADIPEDRMIIFSPEVTQFAVTIFTDIDCTYCRRLHNQIDEYLAQGIEIRYLLYPRNGPATASWAKAEQVWCASDRNEALTLAKLDRKFETRDCDASVVHSHYAAGQDVGLRGTPAIVLHDGTMVSGYLPPLELSEALLAMRP